MSAGNTLKREFRVAFSPRAQPVWFRILKWTALLVLGAWFWRSPTFWWSLLAAFGVALTLHFIWRWKTKAWTQPWYFWDDVHAADGGPRRDARG